MRYDFSGITRRKASKGIHVRYAGDWDELYFRDYLLTHPETTAEYGALKQKLKNNYEHDRDSYTEAKGEFIRKISAEARRKSKK